MVVWNQGSRSQGLVSFRLTACQFGHRLLRAARKLTYCLIAHVQLPDVRLPPLLTTADEDAVEEEAASARAAGATPAAATDHANWSIGAVGSPLTAQRRILPPIACPHGAPAGTLPIPLHGPTPSGHPSGATPASYGAAGGLGGGLARTTSAATTAFYSMRSESSMSATPGKFSPRPGGEAAAGSMPRSALLAQLAEAGSLEAATAGTPGSGGSGEAGSLGGSVPQSVPHAVLPRTLFRQTSDVAAAAAGSGASFIRSARLSQLAEGTQLGSAGWQPGMAPRHPLWKQPSDLASLAASTQYATPRGMAGTPHDSQGQTPSLLRQASSISQAQDLSGFDLSAHDGNVAAAVLSPRMQQQQQQQQQPSGEQPLERPPRLQPQLSCLSQALSGFEGSVSGGLVSVEWSCRPASLRGPLGAACIACRYKVDPCLSSQSVPPRLPRRRRQPEAGGARAQPPPSPQHHRRLQQRQDAPFSSGYCS